MTPMSGEDEVESQAVILRHAEPIEVDVGQHLPNAPCRPAKKAASLHDVDCAAKADQSTFTPAVPAPW